MNINVTDTRQVTEIIHKAVEVFKLPLNSLLSRSRKQELNLARMCISNIALEDYQVHKVAIAEALQRDRSSIYHYQRSHKSLYENWATYRNKFNLLHSSLFNRRRNLISRSEIKKLFRENGLKAVNGAPTIIITSGKMSYKFKTSYAEMCETVEKIKDLLIDHEKKIDIQI
jgi:hypothetical protein